jgi:hypothetical protein
MHSGCIAIAGMLVVPGKSTPGSKNALHVGIGVLNRAIQFPFDRIHSSCTGVTNRNEATQRIPSKSSKPGLKPNSQKRHTGNVANTSPARSNT